MLNTLVKGLIAVGVAAVGVGVVVAATRKKKYAETTSDDFEEEISEDPTLKEKIAQAAIKMVNWITENKDQLEAASVVIGLMASCMDLASKINEKVGPKLNLPFKPKKTLIVNNPDTKDKYTYYEF